MEAETESRTGVPAPGLRGLVTYHGYSLRGLDGGRHRGLPSPYLTLIVTFGEALTMRVPDGSLVEHDVAIGGLHTEPVEIVHGGRQAGVHIALHPLAARRLLGLPSAELTPDVDAAALLGATAREMHDRVAEADDWQGSFDALDTVLARRLADDAGAPAPELARAWRSLVRAEPASVRAVADDVGWSDRHLWSRFRSEFGVAPKVAARIARFDRARRVIARRALADVPLALADVAVEGGYADQAHLTREFRSLAGLSPTQWLAEELGNVQDAPAPEEPGS